jgi:Flp pilus assembly protein TadG
LPLLLILALGVIEIGRYAYIAILVGNAAHAGAAYGAQSGQQSKDPTSIKNAAYYDFSGAIDDSSNTNGQVASILTVDSARSCGCNSAGSIVTYGCTVADGNPTPGACPVGSRWVVFISVTAHGTFNSLFNYPGIPASLVISRTATLPVVAGV